MSLWDTPTLPVVERSPIAAERLERLRGKLLDLTTSNRMLSFRHPKASCLRVADELPGVLFQSLVDGGQLIFEAVEEPSRRELEAWHARRDQVPRAGGPGELKRPDAVSWAKHLGIATDYDLPVETDSHLRPDRHGDRKIQTLHYPDELDARLRKIRAAGRSAIEESGANMLYLAFGFLEWRDAAASRAHQAPLLLLPVELEREQTRGGRYRTKVRWTNEEVLSNLSLRKKLEEFNIKLPDYDEEQGAEDYFTEVARAVRHKSDWLVRRYVTLGLFEFGKILLYLDLDPERWPKSAPIDGHPLVRSILEGEDRDDAQGPLTGGERADDAQVAFRDLHLEVVDRADSSQCEALQMALDGRNLVIEGPPGTGKSQTITNLVAAALARGKTVLFVAEKLAALEVVRRRLRELGLGDFCLELHSHKTRKTEVLDDVTNRLKATASGRAARDLQAALKRLAEQREKLSAYVGIVGRPAGAFTDLSVSDALLWAGRSRRKLGAAVKQLEALRLSVEGADRLGWGDLAEAKRRLRQFVAAFGELGVEGSAYGHPWAGVSGARVLPHDADRTAALATAWADAAEAAAKAHEQADLAEMSPDDAATLEKKLGELDALRDTAQTAERLFSEIERLLGLSLPRTPGGVAQAVALLQVARLAPLDRLDQRTAFTLTSEAGSWLRQFRDHRAGLRERRVKLAEVFRDDAFRFQPDDLEEWAAALAQRGFFVRLGGRWRRASAAWQGSARPAYLAIRPAEKSEMLAAMRSHLQAEAVLRANRQVEERLGARAWDDGFDLDGAIKVADWAADARQKLGATQFASLSAAGRPALVALAELGTKEADDAFAAIAGPLGTSGAATVWDSLLGTLKPAAIRERAARPDEAAWTRLRADVGACARALRTANAAEKAFGAATDLDGAIWFGAARPDLTGVASRARLAAASADSLPAWLDFDRFRRSSVLGPEAAVVHAATSGSLGIENLDICLDFLISDRLARQALGDSPSLLATSGKVLDALREEYSALDAQIMELRRAVIAAVLLQRPVPPGVGSGLKSQLTEAALLRAETAKQKRHIPIRQLVARAGRALQALKPCFMMGPLSVAQYIAPGSLKFDLVIMDEASQMRPEDAIGALARGGQAVIVGDPKQLPPTSFFDRIAERAGDEEDEEEVTLAEDSKSILELASSIYEQRMLQWHYRSRHEALIAFSNREFYRDELMVFPSPAGQGDRYGLAWTFVDEGVFSKGVNPMEARVVARAAAEFLLAHPGRSLGVVAMNIRQAQRISEELAAMANLDPVLGKALAEAESESGGEPFFVKNLENVQGDERDVIMISMTYGPGTVGGRTPQNFGPINQETGWRRLNVLFTRAKERMAVFSSMRSSDVTPKEGGDRGLRSLKLFLEYAETGVFGAPPQGTGRDPDSDFEHAVIEGLTDLNFKCVPQVGVANFFLDIGIADPHASGEYVAAIECDGAAYHSTRSARDRDRLRQEILENLGWKIIRVWSTDWFRDPDKELARISAELSRLIEARSEQRSKRQAKVAAAAGESSEAKREASQDEAGKAVTAPPLALEEGSHVEGALRTLSVEQARAKLIDLRENTIKTRFPDADPTRGLLRKSMLDELLLKRPTDLEEFQSLIRVSLRQGTNGEELREFGEQVFDIILSISA